MSCRLKDAFQMSIDSIDSANVNRRVFFRLHPLEILSLFELLSRDGVDGHISCK